ncbi:MAG: translation elongation factor Ts [bacterium]
MAISAAQIKELRARTGAGMMDCKAALGETGGDLDAAIEALRKKGVATAEKKAGRIAAEGVIALAGDARAAALVEVNCETDFVAKDASFTRYADAVAAAILAARPADSSALGAVALDGGTVEQARQELIAKIGENIGVRRFALLEADGDAARVGAYLHGARIGVLVELHGLSLAPDDADAHEQLGRDLAMHIAASRPLCIGEDDMPAQMLAKEREIFLAQAADSGKPPQIAEKMVAGRMKKFLKENTLLGQPFVKNPEQSVQQLIAAASAQVARMVRFEVGEGLAKRGDDFVAEVMAQADAAR